MRHPEVEAPPRGNQNRSRRGSGPGWEKRHCRIANLTVESLVDQAKTILVSAMGGHQYLAAVPVLRKSHFVRKRIERTEIGAPGEFDAMSDADLRAALREWFARLDSEGQLAINSSITLNGGGHDE